MNRSFSFASDRDNRAVFPCGGLVGGAFRREPSQVDKECGLVCFTNVGGGSENLVHAGARVSRD